MLKLALEVSQFLYRILYVQITFLAIFISVHATCLWRPEAGITSPGIRVTGSYESPSVGVGNQILDLMTEYQALNY